MERSWPEKWYLATDGAIAEGNQLTEREQEELQKLMFQPLFQKAARLVLLEAYGKREAVAGANLADASELQKAIQMQGLYRGMIRAFDALLDQCRFPEPKKEEATK